MFGPSPSIAQLVATAVFAIAVLHTFSTPLFEHLAHVQPRHSGLWRLLGEVEVVFGLWAMVLILLLTLLAGKRDAISYLEAQSFREPASFSSSWSLQPAARCSILPAACCQRSRDFYHFSRQLPITSRSSRSDRC